MKTIIVFVAGLYLGAGLFAALLVGAAIPALNVIGKVHLAVIWPVVIYCAPASRGCSATSPEWMAQYMFTFPSQEDGK